MPIISFEVNDEDARTIQRFATLSNQTASAYARHATLAAVAQAKETDTFKGAFDDETDDALLSELRAELGF